jgi:hypothetical protein
MAQKKEENGKKKEKKLQTYVHPKEGAKKNMGKKKITNKSPIYPQSQTAVLVMTKSALLVIPSSVHRYSHW